MAPRRNPFLETPLNSFSTPGTFEDSVFEEKSPLTCDVDVGAPALHSKWKRTRHLLAASIGSVLFASACFFAMQHSPLRFGAGTAVLSSQTASTCKDAIRTADAQCPLTANDWNAVYQCSPSCTSAKSQAMKSCGCFTKDEVIDNLFRCYDQASYVTRCLPCGQSIDAMAEACYADGCITGQVCTALCNPSNCSSMLKQAQEVCSTDQWMPTLADHTTTTCKKVLFDAMQCKTAIPVFNETQLHQCVRLQAEIAQ